MGRQTAARKNKLYRLRRQRAGLCEQCGAPRDTHWIHYCGGCMERSRAKNQARRGRQAPRREGWKLCGVATTG